MEQLQPNGIYRHFKGNLYQVLYVAKHSETLEEYVVYRALYGERGIWVRPKEMFLGYKDDVKRFTFIKEETVDE